MPSNSRLVATSLTNKAATSPVSRVVTVSKAVVIASRVVTVNRAVDIASKVVTVNKVADIVNRAVATVSKVADIVNRADISRVVTNKVVMSKADINKVDTASAPNANKVGRSLKCALCRVPSLWSMKSPLSTRIWRFA